MGQIRGKNVTVMERVCIECGSENTEVVTEEVGKCKTCGAYFDLEELPTRVERIKHKPHKEDEDGDE